MAKTFVALLRGVNVGRGNRVAMADLRAVVERLGYEDVRTLLNSGNVVFEVPEVSEGDPGRRIEKALETELGVRSRVIAFDAATLERIVDENPLAELATNPSRLLVTVLASAKFDAALETVLGGSWHPEAIARGSRALYLWCPNGSLESPANVAAGKVLGDAATSRTWSTVLKLRAMCAKSGRP